MQKMRTVLIEHALANSEAERNVNTSVFAKVAMFEEKLRAALPREVEATRAAVENGTAAKANRITECKSYSLYRFVCKELRTEYLTGKKIDAVARILCSSSRSSPTPSPSPPSGTPHVERHRTTSTSVPLLLAEEAVEHERHHTARARSRTLMQKMRTVLIEHALANSEAERNVNISVFAKVAMFEEELRAALPREVEATPCGRGERHRHKGEQDHRVQVVLALPVRPQGARDRVLDWGEDRRGHLARM
ncbi:hypothetical protein OsJ_26842 [Oryza sativa Japonica Group]|uniref:Phenylalanine ammonia-lyase n=1 Tax=Oryza sativa subsp. japonica TaxID=39947 RepID=B9G086_ORYSJ|nr:hypothetical protein OsJ_26842 [Oryza sativa Japonica Group]